MIVAHNAGFDVGFIRAALARGRSTDAGTARSSTPSHLARRLVRDEVPELQAVDARVATAARPPARATERSTTRSPPPICCTC